MKKQKLSDFRQRTLFEYGSTTFLNTNSQKQSICETNDSQKSFVYQRDEELPVGDISGNMDVSSKNLITTKQNLKWKQIISENLDLSYTILFSQKTADFILECLERETEYFSGDLLIIQVYGKWHQIPRKQVSYGDNGLSYAFSGTRIPALPWTPLMQELKEIVSKVAGHEFNFVLVNRYKDGNDHIGEHRDDEKDLDSGAPIASLSFGQPRDFVFRHKDSRGSKCIRKLDPVMLVLEHGSLLMMNAPTNNYWYHSLPVRKKAVNARINLTFRKIIQNPKKK